MTELRTSWTGAAAMLFDLDGVLTPTAVVHEQAWQELFDGYLSQTGHAHDYQESDYFNYIDGKPRFDGVRDFLTSRGITVPEGPSDDDPAHPTVQGLGNRKNLIFNQILESHGVVPYGGSVRFIGAVLTLGLKVAVVSSSRNAPAVLKAAGLDGYFPVVVDGQVAADAGLPGKPDPATFEYAAKLLDVPPEDCIVVEDAVSGVKAGSAGHFRAVIGVNRGAATRRCSTQGPRWSSATLTNFSNWHLRPSFFRERHFHGTNQLRPAALLLRPVEARRKRPRTR